jgi:hypothetical protein
MRSGWFWGLAESAAIARAHKLRAIRRLSVSGGKAFFQRTPAAGEIWAGGLSARGRCQLATGESAAEAVPVVLPRMT